MTDNSECATLLPMTTPRKLTWILRTINGVGRGLARVGFEPGLLEVEPSLARARAQTGLDDFGPTDFLEPFELLCTDVRAMGRDLNTVGRLGLTRDFQRSLSNRLRMQELLRRHPEIRQEPIAEPLFIIGSPRTGTTMLHNLLSRAPGAAAPLLWELLEPAPRIDQPGSEVDPRIVAAQRLEAEIGRVVPQLQSAHPMVWDWPEECLWLHANSFMSELYIARLALPEYRRMFLAHDWSWVMKEYRLALQVLQWQRGQPVRWVLKAPGHMFRMRALMAEFPDARFIRTHRDPRKTIASTCSLFELGHLPANRTLDPRDVGQEVLGSWVDVGLPRLVEASEAIEPARCFDVDFRVLMKDPFALIERMWAHFGLELGDQAAMRAWLSENPRHSKGRHTYELGRYGISEAQALERTEGYRARFAEFLE